MPTWKNPVYDLPSALWVIGILKLLRVNFPNAQIQNYVLADYPGAAPIVFRDAASDCPAYAWWVWQGQLFVVVDGLTTIFQANAFLSAYQHAPATGTNGERTQIWVDAAATKIIDDFSLSQGSALRFWSAGWSAGGAIAQQIPLRLSNSYMSQARPVVVTFGAPRAGTTDFQNASFRRLDVARYMNDTDPVPLIPPTYTQFPALVPVWGVRGFRNANNFVQAGPGYNIDPDGAITSAELPSNAVLNISVSIANWLLGQDGLFGASHALEEYERRIGLDVAPIPAVVIRNPAPQEQPRPVLPGQVAQAFTHSEQALFNEERAQNAVAVVIPKSVLAFAFKNGRTWYVGFGDSTICACGSKRKARQLARRLNSWLRSLQSTAVVDTQATIAQLFAYFAEASSPQGRFQPPMNVLPPS